MANLTTREFWAATGDRTIKSGAQSLVTLIGADAVNIVDIDWQNILGITATMMLLSVLTSIVGDTVGKNGPSFVRAEGIGIENAEAEEALRRERAGELTNRSSEVSSATDASAGDDEDERPLLFGNPDDPEETGEVETADPDIIDDEQDLDTLAAAEEDDTPPPEDYRPRH